MVGNAVNIGTAHGNADGIRLDSLLKLADVKVSASAWPAPLLWAGAWPLLVSLHVGPVPRGDEAPVVHVPAMVLVHRHCLLQDPIRTR